MISLILAGSIGYVLGSVPTAFILVHWNAQRDIRTLGSRNVGTLNSYEVTGSPLVGVLVLLGDFVKGYAAVMIARQQWDGDFTHAAVAGVGALVGHNFPVWLAFKGGRGLATGAALMVAFAWMLVVLWGVLWSIGYGVLRSVNPANAVASVASLLVVLLVPDDLLGRIVAAGVPVMGFRFFASATMLVILLKHIGPVLDYVRERRDNGSRLE